MNAPEKFLTAYLGEAEVRVPESLAIAAYLEQQMDLLRPLPLELAQTVERIGSPRKLPAIGDPWDEKGEEFSGLTLHDDRLHALILLPGEREAHNWNDSMAWGRERQGWDLPSRFDGLVLLKNMKSRFKPEYYWLNEQHADAAGYAWCQDFFWGSQYGYDVSLKLFARRVRRVPI